MQDFNKKSIEVFGRHVTKCAKVKRLNEYFQQAPQVRNKKGMEGKTRVPEQQKDRIVAASLEEV